MGGGGGTHTHPHCPPPPLSAALGPRVRRQAFFARRAVMVELQKAKREGPPAAVEAATAKLKALEKEEERLREAYDKGDTNVLAVCAPGSPFPPPPPSPTTHTNVLAVCAPGRAHGDGPRPGPRAPHRSAPGQRDVYIEPGVGVPFCSVRCSAVTQCTDARRWGTWTSEHMVRSRSGRI